jgi:hypothetical protein
MGIHHAIVALSIAFAGPLGSTPSDRPSPSSALHPQDAKQEKQEQKKDPKVEAYEKAIKDLTKVAGPFTLYQRKRELLLELPEAMLGKLFCVQASFHTGIMPDTLQAGFPVGDFSVDVFRFEKAEDQVWLVRPARNHRWSQDDPLGVAAQRSFPDAILGSFRIEQTEPEKRLLLVNVTQLFFGDFLRLSEAVMAILGGPYVLDREKTSAESIKGFPENTVVRMKMHFASQRGGGGGEALLELLGFSGGSHLEDSRSAPISVTDNLWIRKDTGYMARLADPRVGYFTQDYYSAERFANDDRTERLIIRMPLKKKDPSAKLSEPVQPIVWHIDPSVPKAYRQACAEGILFWNRAFEALGYKNAIQVKYVDDGDKDWDHADGRHNVLRWSMSEGAAYAIAMPRWDPITGEILNASVNLDANMLAAAFREHEAFSSAGESWTARALDVLVRDDDRDRVIAPQDYVVHGLDPVKKAASRQKLAGLGWRAMDCRFAEGKAESSALMWEAMEAYGRRRISKEEYAKEFLKECVSHEIGHTLGLRHNFIASTLLTPKQLADDATVDKWGTGASVMDYTPVNVMAVVGQGRSYFTPRIGPYDEWAIRYGYMDVPEARTPLGERYALSRVASLSGKPEHRFMTDEEADGFDPYVVRFDNSREPLSYSGFMLQALAKVREYAINRLPRPGESYAKRTALILTSIARSFREAMIAARFVGGVAGNRNFRGDAGQRPSLAPIDSKEQRKAVRLIARHFFSSSSFQLPADVMLNLSRDPNAADGQWIAPLREQISSQQMLLFTILMSASTTRRIAENAYKLAGDNGAYGLDEHYATLLGAAFSEVGAGRSIDPLRRDLQRFAVNALTVQAGAAPGGVSEDVRMLASDALRRLSTRFGSQLKQTKGLDGMTVAHLRVTKDMIDRFLARVATAAR